VERKPLGRSALEARAPGGDGGAVPRSGLAHHFDGDVDARDEPALTDALEQPPHIDTRTEADLEDSFTPLRRQQLERPAAARAVLPRHQVAHEPPHSTPRVRELREERLDELRHDRSLENDRLLVNMTRRLSLRADSAKLAPWSGPAN